MRLWTSLSASCGSSPSARFKRLTLIWRHVCQVSSVHCPAGCWWVEGFGLAWGGVGRVLDVSQSHMRGLAPQVPGFVAGGRVSKNGRGLVRAAHSVTARAGGLRGPAPPHASGRAVGLGYGAVAAAQRKQASSRAHATVITLPGFLRSRIRRWMRCRRCCARQAIWRMWSGWPSWRSASAWPMRGLT